MPKWTGYLLAVVLIVLLGLVLHFLERYLPLERYPMPYALVVMGLAYYFGEGPAILAFVLGFTSYIIQLLAHSYSLRQLLGTPYAVAGVIEFLLGVILVGIATVLMRRNRIRIQELAGDLEESAQKINNIIESIDDGFISIDYDWRFTYVNGAAEKLIERKRDELIGTPIWEAFPAAMNTGFYDEYSKVLRARTAVAFEEYYAPLDRWFEVRAYPSPDGLTAYFADISERKASEMKLKASEDKFAKAFMSSPEIVVISDLATGRYMDVNQSFEDVIGWSREEAIGRTSFELGIWANPHERDMLIQELNQGKAVRNREISFKKKNGEIVIGMLSADIIRLEGKQCLLALVNDITEKMKAEEARRESESMMRALMQGIPDLVIRFGRDGTYLDIHAGVMDGLLLPPEQLLGRKIQDVLPKTIAEARLKTIEQALDTGEMQIVQYQIEPEGKKRDFEGRIVPSSDDEVIFIARDITEEIRFREELQRSYEREHRIAETLQESLLQPVPKSVGVFKIETLYRAALDEARVGGDFYDAFRTVSGKLVVTIGDVSGKGLSAAVLVAAARYYIRGHAYESDNPSAVLNHVNRALVNDLDIDSFITIFVGLLDSDTRTLTYASAGHSPALLWKNSSQQAVMLDSTGPVLGINFDTSYREKQYRLEPGDELLLGTDGLYEVRCGTVFLEIEGLAELYTELMKSQTPGTQALVDKIVNYCGGNLRDDIAVVRTIVTQ